MWNKEKYRRGGQEKKIVIAVESDKDDHSSLEAVGTSNSDESVSKEDPNKDDESEEEDSEKEDSRGMQLNLSYLQSYDVFTIWCCLYTLYVYVYIILNTF